MNVFARGRPRRVLVAGCVLALFAAAGMWWLTREGTYRVTAYFGSAVGVYAGSDVRVLGVPVGTVEEVLPEGERVRVRLAVDGSVRVPAAAGAVVVAPTIVSDRYVQLTPAYLGGPTLAGGAVIPPERTATPAEIDQLAAGLDELLTALGPAGANSDGAVSDLLNTGASALDGNGEALRETIGDLGEAGKTLSGTEQDLFGTVRELQKFTSMLAADDDEVTRINGQLADVAGLLAAERGDLGAALHELTGALGLVQGFLQDNRGAVKSNVDNLRAVSQVLVDQRAALEETLDTVPDAFDGLLAAYHPDTGTLDTRTNLNELTSAAGRLCAATGGGCGSSGAAWEPVGEASPELPALPLPAVGAIYATEAAR